jgi:nicotinate-nucleotide pyrophosphorylase (carboxylating)
MYDSRQLINLIKLALDEDLYYGDLTTLLHDSSILANATIYTKQECVVCGVGLAKLILFQLSTADEFKIELHSKDGDLLSNGDKLISLSGNLSLLLAAERTILNFIQKLSGISTHVKYLKDKFPEVNLLDTRKTTPGWRIAEKYAVSVGGGRNHRLHLGDMVLIKNNHIDAQKDNLEKWYSTIIQNKPFYTPIQIEVRNKNELMRILPLQPDSIMLDNMKISEINEVLEITRNLPKRILIEVSGGITEQYLGQLAKLPIDAISTSSLIREAKYIDMSMKVSL